MAIDTATVVEILQNPDSYREFDTDQQGRVPLICIDPRPIEGSPHRSSRQTAGGIVGLGMDYTVAYNAANRGDKLGVREGISTVACHLGGYAIITAHAACKNNESVRRITEEVAEPSDQTLETQSRLIAALRLNRHIPDESLRRVQDGAKVTWEDLVENPVRASELVKSVRAIQGSRVYTMVGASQPGVFVTNLHPGIGLDHHRIFSEIPSMAGRAYHSTLAAMLELVDRTPALWRVPYIKAALVRREAATNTVLTKDQGITQLVARPDHNGSVAVQEVSM